MNAASLPKKFLRLFSLILLATASLARSQAPQSRVTHAIDDSVRRPLVGSKPRSLQGAHDLGALEADRSLKRMMLLLKPSSDQQSALASLVQALHNRNSPSYHKWLKPEEFAAQFGPSEADLDQVKAWLQSRGLTPSTVGRGRQWIEFSGTAQAVNGAFATSMHRFERNGQTHIANNSELSIPQALEPVVTGVLSLNDFRTQPAHSKPLSVKRDAEGRMVPTDPNHTTTDGNGNYFYQLSPADFQTIYNSSPLIKSGVDGTGISIAIAGRSNISLADVQIFRQTFGLVQNDPNIIINGPDPGISPPGNDLVESTLDVEWAGASAPGSTINLVESASSDTTDGIDLSSAYIVDNVVSPIVSVSYGQCEALLGPAENSFYNSLWEQAAAEGMTVFVSTGDGGAAQCDSDLQNNGLEPQGPALHGPSVNGLASSPFDVAVGGTQFNEAGNYAAYWSLNNSDVAQTALGYIPEQAWNESCDPALPQTGTNCVNGQSYVVLEGTGGGPSNCSQSTIDSNSDVNCVGGYPKPSWQTGIGVPSDAVRDLPDLSLNASPDDEGYLLCVFGSCQTTVLNGHPVLEQADIIGGTSASAPSMAGIMALVEQKNGAYQGQANYAFYKLAAADKLASCHSSNLTNPGQPSTCTFNDITLGGNSDPGLSGYGTLNAEWPAGVGYDQATGLGTVNAANMVMNWATLSQAGSSTSLSANATTVAHGQPLTLTIAVSATTAGGAPTGDVALFTDKYGTVGHVTLDATGKFSGPVANLPGGSYHLTARYGGDGSFASSVSAPLALTVTPEGSSVSFHLDVIDPVTNRLAPYAGKLQYEYPLYVGITVTGVSGQGSATGTVNLLNGKDVVLSLPLNSSGGAFFLTGASEAYTLPVGTSTLSVQYSGDNSFGAGSSATQQVSVQQQQVMTNIGIAGDNIPLGQSVFLTASIPPGFGTTLPTGNFQFFDNGKPLGDPMPITSSGADYASVTYPATLPTTGLHTITAGYSGDKNFSAVSGTGKSANPSEFTVVASTGAATVTTIVQTPAEVTYGQSFSYVVTVTPAKAGTPVPTGQVQISSNNNIFGQVTLVNGKGSVVEQVDAGTSEVHAQYSGDAKYAASTSPVITTTVSRYTPTITLTSTAPYVLSGQQTSLSVVVGGYNYGQYGSNAPGGTVQFFTALNGGTPQAISPPTAMLPVQSYVNAGLSLRLSLPTGTNVVTGVYSGNFDFNGVTSPPVTIVVSSPDFLVTSNPPALTVSAGGSTTDMLTLAPILGFNGTVSLSCAGGLPAGATCGFSAASVPGGAGTSTLTITTQGPFTAQARNEAPGASRLRGLCGFAGLLFLGLAARRRRSVVTLLTSIVAIGFLSGCGGHGAPSSTLVVVSSTQAKVASGAAVTFSAQVSGGASAAGGTVTFYDGSTALGSAVDLSQGQATFMASSLSVGTHAIVAKYSGDDRHTGSASQPFYEAVTGDTTVQVVATSGTLSHTLNLNLTVQ